MVELIIDQVGDVCEYFFLLSYETGFALKESVGTKQGELGSILVFFGLGKKLFVSGNVSNTLSLFHHQQLSRCYSAFVNKKDKHRDGVHVIVRIWVDARLLDW